MPTLRPSEKTFSDGLKTDLTEFLQKVYADGRCTYIYVGSNSYEPLAQIHNHTNTEGETKQEINYFHCDQIGIPREMTDRDGNLIWFGEYDAWGKSKKSRRRTVRLRPHNILSDVSIVT